MRRFYLVDTITVKDFKFLKDYKFSKEDEVQFLFIDDSSKIDFKYLYEINNKVKSVGYILCSSEIDRDIFSYKLSTIIGVLSSKLNTGFDEFIIYSNIKELRYGIDTLNNAYKKKVVELVEPNIEPTGLFIDNSIIEYLGLINTEIVYPCRDALLLSKNLQDFHNKLVKIFGSKHGREYYLKLRKLVEPNPELIGFSIEDSIMDYLGLINTEIVDTCRDALLLSENLQDFHNNLVNTFGREDGREYYLKLSKLYKIFK